MIVFKGRMLRTILALAAGIVLGSMTVGANEAWMASRHPMPAGLQYTDAAGMSAYVASLPAAAFAQLVAGWFLGALLGVGVTRALTPVAFAPAAIAAMQVFGVCSNFFAFSHPLWVMIAGPILSLAGSAIGWFVGRRKA